ncbi:hypothetical protein V1517DRAFT_310350 [Lipomyces orientalis]|uniref:Uncharacterized protein n=1 Tax=Lipomyces orientalis TaxID=1233043 RepID=A0ACC3TG86_9ASCO
MMERITERAFENSRTTLRERHRYESSTVANVNKPRGRRASRSRAGESSSQKATYSAGNLAVLQNAIGYLKRAYNIAYDEGKFSDDLADADNIVKRILQCFSLQQTRYSTHTVATSTVVTDATAREVTPVQSRSTVTRSIWTVVLKQTKRLGSLTSSGVSLDIAPSLTGRSAVCKPCTCNRQDKYRYPTCVVCPKSESRSRWVMV